EGESGNDSSVKVSLSRDTSEQNKLQSSSQVQRSNGSYAYFSSSDFARKLSSAVSEMSVDIRSWFGNVQADENGHLIEISSPERIKTQEGMSLEATGKVQTEDGRIIDFMLSLDFKRDITEERSSLFSGRGTQMADPLMINMQGEIVQLSVQWFDFELLTDVSHQGISITEKRRGYLDFDKTHIDRIVYANELIGHNTNHGFAELALSDEDRNR